MPAPDRPPRQGADDVLPAIKRELREEIKRLDQAAERIEEARREIRRR